MVFTKMGHNFQGVVFLITFGYDSEKTSRKSVFKGEKAVPMSTPHKMVY